LMGLIFADASLSFDSGHRDSDIFAGLKKLYNIPEGVSYRDIKTARGGSEHDRHNYTGDKQAVRELIAKYQGSATGTALAANGAGRPAIAVA
jgi:hypothetical protein